MTAWSRYIRATALALVMAAPCAASANGIAGDYLAARQASFLGDFDAAARFYGRALAFDPTRPELLERAILANISLGKVDRAALYSDTLGKQGFASQLAQLATVASDAKSEDFAKILTDLEAKRGVGALADGMLKAWSRLGLGDKEGAMDAFDEVAALPGLEPFAAYHRALALASQGEFAESDAILTKEGQGGMSSTRRGTMARVEILSQLGRNEDALDLLTRSFGKDLDPGLATMRGALEAGESLPFSHVTNAREGIAEVFFSLAGALSSEQNDELTLLYSRIAEYLRSDHVDAILLSAEVLDQMQQFDLAEQTFARVAEDHPAYHAAELGRAEALRARGESEAAVAVLEALKATHGDLPIVHSTLGDFLRQLERFEESAAAYTDALDRVEEVTRRQWFIFYARGISHERLDNWERAEADFRRALALNPDQPQVLNYLGYSLVEKQMKLDEALAMIERAVAARPDSGYIVDSLGWVLYRLGRYDEAVEPMERAAELMPIDPIVNDHLGDVYWAVGREREAEFMWRRALSFVDWEDAAEEADPERIKRKIEVGLDQVLLEEGSPPLQVANDISD